MVQGYSNLFYSHLSSSPTTTSRLSHPPTIQLVSPYHSCFLLLINLSQQLTIPEQRKLLLAHLHGTPPILRNQHLIPLLNGHDYPVPALVQSTGADGENFGFAEFFDGRLGQEDAAGSLGLGFDALHEDAVEEGDEGAD
jgi:hypothetical protein